MKLSDAILLGSTLSGQAWRTLETGDGRRCALGGALAAEGIPFIGRLGTKDAFLLFRDLWPHLLDRSNRLDCPARCGTMDSLAGLIAHLNDTEEWTRERIAAYVVQFDPEEVPIASDLRNVATGEDDCYNPLMIQFSSSTPTTSTAPATRGGAEV